MNPAALVALLTEACKALATIAARWPRRIPPSKPLTDAERIIAADTAKSHKRL